MTKMPKLDRVVNFSGDAKGRDEALANPLELLSAPLHLDQNGAALPDLAKWELPKERQDSESGDITAQEEKWTLENIGEGDEADDTFLKHLCGDRLVVLAPFNFIIELGVLPSWLTDKATRKDAEEIIAERNLWPLLEGLSAKGKENNKRDLIGQAAIYDFFRHSPEVRREKSVSVTPDTTRAIGRHAVETRVKHCLRLRKAIELIILIEAALKYRYPNGKSLNRTNNYTGVPTELITHDLIWDILWLEPVNRIISSPPRPGDIPAIMEDSALLEEFQESTGQQPGALKLILEGLPGKTKTVQAACEVVNRKYSDLPPSVPTSANPVDFSSAGKVFRSHKDEVDIAQQVELIPEFGPDVLSSAG